MPIFHLLVGGRALSAPGDGQELCQKKYLKIFDINSEVFIKACNLLRIHQVQGRDWRGLAGKLGYNVEQVLVRNGETFLYLLQKDGMKEPVCSTIAYRREDGCETH